ncbi:MAG TPA: BTAD domain-containing putative transcriptional regulator [Gaiellaceae bacterium]|nr:BTAD domain-containing putative transcriptional regulator [Gaiellaceae bacterium]
MPGSSRDGLEFAVLGPVEVRRDGHPLALAGLRQRALLAFLVLHAGEVVSSDRLISALFGEDASGGAANALQQSISRLRRTLGEDGAPDQTILVTRSPGYVLHVEPDRVDLQRFELLLHEAHRTLDRGDTEGAVSELREALALWRGPPLADLTELEFAQGEIRRLEELRLGATMDRIDAELALGQAADVIAELEGLVGANPYQERLRAQLMLALYRSGRQADALQAYRDARELLRDELGLEPGRAIQELERAILVHEAALDVSPRHVETPGDVAVCPFKGLASFDLGDSRFFCGRERVVDDLVARLAENTLVGVVGPSGIGKSSVLRAGLLRALASGALPGSERWPSVAIRPGRRPRIELERVFELTRTADRYVVAVDQFEELFTVCSDEDERGAFIDALVAAVHDPDRRAVVTLALRADFYGRCAGYPELARLLSASHVLIGPMQRDELARAISVPAERAGLEVEDGLVSALVDDVSGEPGGLPLLSTTLLELWRRRDGSILRLADYHRAGGVHGAVGRLAEHTYDDLDDEGKQVARGLMLRLAGGDADNAVRRRVPTTDLTRGLGEADRVLGVLIDARLLTVDDGSVEVAHEALLREWPRMREWLEEEGESRRLEAHVKSAAVDWDAGGREAGDLYRGPRLSAVLDWQAGHAEELGGLEHEFIDASRNESERELDAQKRRNRRLRTLAGGIFVLLVLALLAGGAALLQRGTARREARDALARQLGAEALTEPRIDTAMLLSREAVNLSRSTQTEGTLLATLLRSPGAIATFTSPITSRPQRLSVTPDGQTLAVADNTATVRFYSLATRRLHATVFPLGYGTAPTFSADGKQFVEYAGTSHAELELADAHTLKRLAIFALDRRFLTAQSCGSQVPILGPTQTVDFAYCTTRPDGSDGPAFIDQWSLTSHHRTVTAQPLGIVGANVLQSVPGGRLVVAGDTEALVLDGRTLRVLRRLPLRLPPAVNYLNAEAVSDNGRVLAAGGFDGTVRFVDLRTGRMRSARDTLAGTVNSVAFSPDGRTLATGTQDGNVIVWDVSSGTIVDRLTGHATRVLGVAFGPDGKTLYSCSLDGAIFVWDLGTTRRFGLSFGSSSGPLFVTGPDERSIAPPLAVSPDGRRFATRLGRTRVGIFDTDAAKLRSAFTVRAGGDIGALAWSKDGLLAVSGDEGHVQLWDVSGRPRLVRALHGMGSVTKYPEAVTTLAFSPDGSLLAAGDVNHTAPAVQWRYGTAAVWDVAAGRLLWQKRSKRGWVNSVKFSPDGESLAAGDESGVVAVYEAGSGRLGRTIRTEGGLHYTTLAYEPNGTLATGSYAGIVQLWNPATGRELGRPTAAAAAPVSSIAFDPTGSTFATTGGSDGIAKLWTTATLQQFGSNLRGAPNFWGNAQFTPDGGHLVVVWEDGTGSVWPTSVAALEAHACAVAGRNFTRTEWRQFVGGSYRTTCPGQRGVSGE